MMGASCYVLVRPAPAVAVEKEACRKHAGSTHHYLLKAESKTHTTKATFLGSTQEAHMGATCVLPSVASLTGRAVYLNSKFV